MYDENGIWSPETYNQPMGGTLGALAILNQFQSYNNYKRNRARQSLSDLGNQATLGEKHGQDFSQYPEGAQADQALDISPDTATGVFKNIPQQVIGRALAEAQAAKGDEPLDEDEVSKIYMANKQTPPAAYLRSSTQKDIAAERADSSFNTQLNKAGKDAYDLAWNQGQTQKQSRQAQVDAWRAFHGSVGRQVTPEQETAWKTLVDSGSDEAGPKVKQQIATGAAREADLYSKAGLSDEQAQSLRALRDAKVAETWANADMKNERTAFIQLSENIAQAKIDRGGLTAAGMVGAEAKIAALEASAAEKADKAQYRTGSSKQATAQAIKQAYESADALRAMLGRPPKHGTAPELLPGKATPAGGAADTKESIAAAYKAGKITRDEAAQKLKALGIPESK